MTDKEKEAIERLKLDITKPLYYREQTIVNVDDLETVLNLIQTQQEEIEKKDKVIDEMANKLHKLALYYDDEGTYCEMKNEICDELDNLEHVEDIHKHCTSCIKEYFINKVEKENK